LDGEESVSDSPAGRTKLRAKWEGDRLDITIEQSGAASILSWSLSADGKALTLVGTAFIIRRQETGEKVTEELKVKRVYQRR
jgi:hypothetical protein